MSLAPHPEADTSSIQELVLSPQEIELRNHLWEELRADGLASNANVVIEFEFHDLFINEEIPGHTLMLKYQRLLRMHGLKSGPQRQIHINEAGQMVIGDFNDWGDLIGEPIRLGLAIAARN